MTKELNNSLLHSDLVTLAIHRTRLGAQRGCASCPSPAMLAVTFKCRGITPTVAATGSRAQREGVSCIEAQEVVIGIAEKMEEHLNGKMNTTNILYLPLIKDIVCLFDQIFMGYLARLGFNRLR